MRFDSGLRDEAMEEPSEQLYEERYRRRRGRQTEMVQHHPYQHRSPHGTEKKRGLLSGGNARYRALVAVIVQGTGTRKREVEKVQLRVQIAAVPRLHFLVLVFGEHQVEFAETDACVVGVTGAPDQYL